jgi:creatinine amidohydrolase
MGEWLFRAGFRRLFIVNGHVGNAAALRCALDTLRCRHEGLKVALFSDGDLSPTARAVFCRDGDDWHANAAETGLMMALAPEMVREDERVNADDPDRTANCVFAHPVNHTSANGVTGRPSEASREDGEALFAELVETLCEKVLRGLSEEAPLPGAYYQRIESHADACQ